MKLNYLYILLFCFPNIYSMELSELEKQFLHAAGEGETQIVQDCIAKKVNINVGSNKYNETAFYKAVRLNRWPVVHLLLEQPNLDIEKTPISAEPRNATTPMHMLFKKCSTPEHFTAIKRVLKLKPNLDVLDGRKDTPLQYELSSFANVKVVELLVKAGAGMIPDKDNKTPLSNVVDCRPELVVQILHSPHLSLGDLINNMSKWRPSKLLGSVATNDYYGKKLSFEVMKTYYNVMLTLGHIDPLDKEWRKAARTGLNVPLLTTIAQAKSIAAHVAEARFKMLHNAWCNA